MRTLPDHVLDHLRDVGDWPDLDGTRYEVIAKIGQGGMGTVYRTRDNVLDRLVALKVLNVNLNPGQFAGRLTREAQILGALEHPGIVPVHDLGLLPDGRVFYVMKLVNGIRLDDYVATPRLVSEKLQVFLKICDAVGFAHSLGIVHRDLKPQNVMIGSYGEVLVLDWGVAGFLNPPKRGQSTNSPNSPDSAELGELAGELVDCPLLGRGGDRTVEGTVIGTPGYMSPEQASGSVRLISARSDVYSLGAILKFLLTGPPARVTSGERPPAESLPEGMPKPLHAICFKAMAVDPAERYDAVRSLAGDVQRFLAGVRVAAYPETPWDTMLRLGRRYRTPLLLVLAYLVMRILLLFWTRL